jgi:malonyl-CoA O-methyltransferase
MSMSPDSPSEHPSGEGAPICARAWSRTAQGWADGSALPWLHQEVARRLADRLSVIRAQPEVVLEWEARAGQSRSVLQAAYPNAHWVPVATSAAGLPALYPPAGSGFGVGAVAETEAVDGMTGGLRQRLGRRLGRLGRRLFGSTSAPPCAVDTTAAAQAAGPGLLVQDVPAGHGQLIWSNLGLHAEPFPHRLLQAWHAALAVDGFLMFSTFGPDTLRELRSLWEAFGWGPPAQVFRDMHDWGDDLVAAGFADPVMDQETLRLTWADADAALAELRTLGRNAHPGRHPGCRTPRWKSRMKAALQGLAGPDGRIALTFEIVYGHAFRPLPRPRLDSLSTVSLQDMRQMVQSARRTR